MTVSSLYRRIPAFTSGALLGLCASLGASAASAPKQPPAGQATASEGVLFVVLSGMKSDDGSITYAMWAGPEGWLETNTVREGSVPIVDGTSELRFDDLPYGEYAISVYHDKNDNGKLDTGLFGIPKEPFGFSNDPSIGFGPPKYKDSAFMLEAPELTIQISVKKLF
jgi:uncharacterized protein (DUF2141 family)